MLKYIIYEDLSVALFSPSLVHATMARTTEKGSAAISAGFCKLTSDLEIEVGGGSATLGLESREEDKGILEDFLTDIE